MSILWRDLGAKGAVSLPLSGKVARRSRDGWVVVSRMKETAENKVATDNTRKLLIIPHFVRLQVLFAKLAICKPVSKYAPWQGKAYSISLRSSIFCLRIPVCSRSPPKKKRTENTNHSLPFFYSFRYLSLKKRPRIFPPVGRIGKWNLNLFIPT